MYGSSYLTIIIHRSTMSLQMLCKSCHQATISNSQNSRGLQKMLLSAIISRMLHYFLTKYTLPCWQTAAQRSAKQNQQRRNNSFRLVVEERYQIPKTTIAHFSCHVKPLSPFNIFLHNRWIWDNCNRRKFLMLHCLLWAPWRSTSKTSKFSL